MKPLPFILALLLSATFLSSQAQAQNPLPHGDVMAADILKIDGLSEWTFRYPTSSTDASNNATTGIVTVREKITMLDADTSTVIALDHSPDISCNFGRFFTQISLEPPSPLNLTSIQTRWGVGVPCHSTTSYWWVINSTGDVIHNQTFASGTQWINGTFSSVASIKLVTNTGISGGGTQGAENWAEFHAWDSNASPVYPITAAYVDYLSGPKAGVVTTTGAISTPFTSGTFQIPPGTGFYFAAAPKIPATSCPVGVGPCLNLLEPVPNSTDVTFKTLHVGYSNQGKSYVIYSYTNNATSVRTATLQTSMGLPTGTIFPQWEFQLGSLFAKTSCTNYVITATQGCPISTGITTTPFGNATCTHAQCKTTMVGFGYKNNTGPFTTLASFGMIGWGDIEGLIMDRDNSFTLDIPLFDAGEDRETITIPEGTYAGNVPYLNLWQTAEDTNEFCQVTESLAETPLPGGFLNPLNWFLITLKAVYLGVTNQLIECTVNLGNNGLCGALTEIQVNGNPTAPAYTTFNFERSLANPTFPDGQLVLGCLYILDDYQRSANIPKVEGQNTYLDNLVEGRTYEIILPPELVATDNPWRSISSFGGNHSSRTICNLDTAICHANANTVGWPVGGFVPTSTFTFQVNDHDTGQPLPGVSVFEVVTSEFRLTNASGGATFTIPVIAPTFSFVKDGYNTVVQAFDRAVEESINTFTVNMTRDTSKQFQEVNCSLEVQGISCSSTPTSDVSESCTTINLGSGQCLKGPIFGTGLKATQFVCPADVSSNVIRPLSNVTAREASSGFSRTMSLASEVWSLDCFGGETTEVQSANQQWTFSKIGYRTINFNADWLDKSVIRFAVFLKQGNGDASSLSITVQNTTIIHSGIAKPGTFIQIVDSGAAAPIESGGSQGIVGFFISLGEAVGFTGTDGNFWLGIILFVAISAFVLLVWGRVAPSSISAISVIPAAVLGWLAVSFTGLWPDWVFGVIVLVIIAALVFVFRGRIGGGATGEGGA